MRNVRRQRRRHLIVVFLSLFLIIVTLCSWVAWFLKTTVEPAMEEIGMMRARSLITKMVNKAINDQFREELDTDDLIIHKINEKGETVMVQADTKAINLLITEISAELQEEYRTMGEDIISVPAGALLGSKIFSQTGPKVKMRVIPLSVSGMDFKTEFETQGINQTKYKVYIRLKSQVKVLAPFSSNTIDTASTILIAEAVILGTVPDSYVQVPKEDILDVT
ncbi:MAG: sporulation protein YunB [Firmicutes bacterium]|nr:sporulation protein YunB [Bacillota bacterium]